MDETEQPYTTTVVRLSFLPDHRDKIDTSEEWYKVLDAIKHQPNFGYACKGESIDDELDVVLIIAWENAAKPPAAFLSGDVDCIFSPLNAFLVKKPQIMGTLHRKMRRGRWTHEFDTSGAGMQFMAEFMTIRGPAHAVGPAMGEIEKRIRSYLDARFTSLELYDNYDCTLLNGALFHMGDDCEEHSDEASFILLLKWRGPEQRNEFHDADIPDRGLAPQLQSPFPSNFWQETIVQRLERLGATTSSWIYHKAEIARDETGSQVIASEFVHQYRYAIGYRG